MTNNIRICIVCIPYLCMYYIFNIISNTTTKNNLKDDLTDVYRVYAGVNSVRWKENNAEAGYELFVNGNSIGTGQYSTQDIAMPGRAAFYPGAEIPLKSNFQLVLSDVNARDYQSITRGESIQYSVEGTITTESAWSLVDKEFQSSLG